MMSEMNEIHHLSVSSFSTNGQLLFFQVYSRLGSVFEVQAALCHHLLPAFPASLLFIGLVQLYIMVNCSNRSQTYGASNLNSCEKQERSDRRQGNHSDLLLQIQ